MLVFFPHGSPEHPVTTRTRALVSKCMSATLLRDGFGAAGKAVALVGGGSSADSAKKSKEYADVSGSLLEKVVPVIVCRKRSSIAKAAAANKEKVEKEDTDEDEEFDDGKKKGSAKDKTRGMRTNKGRAPVRNAAPNQKTGKASESAAAERTKKSDKMVGSGSGSGSGGGKAAAAAGGVIKKRNAVDFLKRMKQNSVPSTERVSLLETLKLSATEQKKAAKADGRKEPGSSSGSKKATAETASGGRRSVGRPPKRAAAPPTPPPSKRAKDDRPTRKRGKK